MNITPSVEEFAVKVTMQALKEDREIFYTRLVEGIEGLKKSEGHDEDCDGYCDAMGCTSFQRRHGNRVLTDILENVVKPLYGKE